MVCAAGLSAVAEHGERWLARAMGYHAQVICTAAFWINPLVAPRSFFVCARKLAQKHTSIPRAGDAATQFFP
jgi:hypothetical protein